jgi:hypothetical protein
LQKSWEEKCICIKTSLVCFGCVAH